MLKKPLQQHFMIGEQITWWDSYGHQQFGMVESPVREVAGVQSVKVEGAWICLDCISIDGKDPEMWKDKVGRMRAATGGNFGFWVIDDKCYKVTDWEWTGRHYARFYTHKKQKLHPAILVKTSRTVRNEVEVYTVNNTLYKILKIKQKVNECGQLGCDYLNEYLVHEILKKG
jgi:hypothetical protein